MKLMVVKNKQISDPFAKALDHYMRVKGWTNDEMGIAVGYKNGKMISAIRLEKTYGSETMRRAIAEKLGYTLDSFIKEGNSLLSGTLPAVTGQATAHSNMHKLPARRAIEFQNQTMGQEITAALTEIEKMDPGELIYFRDIILQRLDHLRTNSKNQPGPQAKSSTS